MTYHRAAIVLLLLLATASTADAGISTDREFWLKAYRSEDGRLYVGMWASGASDTMAAWAISSGCPVPKSPTGSALMAVTADLLQDRAELPPWVAAALAFKKLTGCTLDICP
jgi:hypothetical protein